MFELTNEYNSYTMKSNYYKYNNSLAVFKIINLFCIVVYLLWYITPYFRVLLRGNISNIVIVGILTIWLITSILINPTWLIKLPTHLYIVSLMLLIFISMAVFNIKGNPREYLMLGTSFWFPVYIFNFYKVSNQNEYLRLICKIVITALFIIGVTTIVGLYAVPNAIRALSNSKNDIQQDLLLMRNNIGGVDFVYGIILLIPVLIGDLDKNKKKKIILTGFIVWIVIKSSFTIAFLICCLALVLGLLSKYNKWVVTSITLFLFLLIIILPSSVFSYPFIWLTRIIDNPTVGIRLLDIAHFLEYGNSLSGIHLDARIRLYGMSWSTFLDNPIIGIGPYYYISNMGIGYHSQILDDLARYGIVGGFFITLFIVTYYEYVRKMWIKNGMKQKAYTIFLVFLTLCCTNLTFSQPTIGVIMFLLIPSMPMIMSDKLDANRIR